MIIKYRPEIDGLRAIAVMKVVFIILFNICFQVLCGSYTTLELHYRI